MPGQNTKLEDRRFNLEQEQLINLVCQDKFKYLEKRLNSYEYIFEYHVENILKSLQFLEINENSETNEVLVYFGPAISIDNTYIYFLLDIVSQLILKNSGKKILLLAEIQNPKLYFRLKDFFGDLAAPKDIKKISFKESINLEKFYKHFSHLLDPQLNNGWISKSESKKNFCTMELSKTKENRQLLDFGVNLENMEQILFMVEFSDEIKEQRNSLQQLKSKLNGFKQNSNIFQRILNSKGKIHESAYTLRPN